MKAAEKLLRELIVLPSINPAFLPADDSRAGEKQVADYLAALAANAGMDVEFQEVFPGRSNLITRLQPKGNATRRVVLAPHLDTVSVNDESQLDPKNRNGKLHGRGACDTKGSVAAMFSAVLELAKRGQRPTGTEIVFAGLVDEEHAQTGSRVLARSGFKADLGIVGEPTRLQVVTAHKGDVWLRVRTRGRAAHGARPELGKNAIHEMGRVIELLAGEYTGQLRHKRHRLLGRGTINVGVVRGGAQPNIVPDQCELHADRRTLPGENERTVLREVRTLFRRHRIKAAVESMMPGVCLPMETDPQLPLVRQFMKCAGQSRAAGVDFFCDATVLAQGGIPSVVFGPGDIAQAHTADEWISLRSLEQARTILVQFLKSLP